MSLTLNIDNNHETIHKPVYYCEYWHSLSRIFFIKKLQSYETIVETIGDSYKKNIIIDLRSLS